jgi:hypothetical protein
VNALVNAAAPTISVQPAGNTYTLNESASAITVTATSPDSGTLSYQWYSNSVSNNFGGTAIGGATGSSYTPSTATSGTVYYYVVVTNTKTVTGNPTATTISGVAAITVTTVITDAETPYITTQPQNASAYIGDNTTISVTAIVYDGGTLSYQWYRNSVNNNFGGAPISGATGRSYSPPAATEGSAYYYVAVTNTNTGVNGYQTATATSNTATVTYIEPTGIDPNPSEEKSLKAIATGGGLLVSGLVEGESLKLYNMLGKLIYNGKATANEQRLYLNAHGIYVVVAGNRRLKTAY